MNEVNPPLVKIEDTKKFRLIVVSDRPDAISLLLPSSHERLGRFRNITLISRFSELLDIYLSNKTEKLVVFVEVTSLESLSELKRMIYGAHSETRGLLFAFTFGQFTDPQFERLVSIGFDDVFELGGTDRRKYSRMYSWIRRFGGTPIYGEFLERERIAFLSNQKDKRIGDWTILVNEMVACDEKGHRVKLTRQEIDFLSLLSDETELVRDGSYVKLFKAPHAIVHKLKKKLGSNLPIRHDSGGRYRLVKDGRGKANG